MKINGNYLKMVGMHLLEQENLKIDKTIRIQKVTFSNMQQKNIRFLQS